MAGYRSNLAKKFSLTEQFPQHILPLLPLYNAQWWGYESLTAIVLVILCFIVSNLSSGDTFLHLPGHLNRKSIVGTHSTLFRYTSYILWDICLAKSRFHDYAWGSWDQSSSNEIACYNKILFNLNNVIQGFSY